MACVLNAVDRRSSDALTEGFLFEAIFFSILHDFALPKTRKRGRERRATDKFWLAAYVHVKPVTLSINKGFHRCSGSPCQGHQHPPMGPQTLPFKLRPAGIWTPSSSPPPLCLSIFTHFSFKVVLIEQDESHRMLIEQWAAGGFGGQHSSGEKVPRCVTIERTEIRRRFCQPHSLDDRLASSEPF